MGPRSHSRKTPDERTFPLRRSTAAELMKPPPDVEYLEHVHLIIWRPRGVLDEAKVNSVLVELVRRETMAAQPFNRFSDLTGLKSFHLTFKYVFHVALHRRLTWAGREPVKSAFFVTEKGAAHIVKIHALLTDYSPLKVEMFDKLEAAAEWLSVPLETLIPRENAATP
jgi:hypothetical protein